MDIYLAYAWIWDNNKCDTIDLGIIGIYSNPSLAINSIKNEYQNRIINLNDITHIKENTTSKETNKIYMMDVYTKNIEIHYSIKKENLIYE